jgi:hypothetical protein
MNDAAELLRSILDSLEGLSGFREMVIRIFGLNTRRWVHCRKCSMTSPDEKFVEKFYTVSATELRAKSMMWCGIKLGPVLRMIQEQEQKKCDKDKGETLLVSCFHGAPCFHKAYVQQ